MPGRTAPHRIPVLITRPQPQADRLAAKVAGIAGTRAVVAPLMQTRFLPVILPPGPFASLILTSEAGAEAAARLRRAGGLPDRALCVGPRTAQVARAAGLATPLVAPDAAALLAGIAQHPDRAPCLYLRGADVTRDLDQDLRQMGLAAAAVVAYAQQECALSDTARTLLCSPGPIVLPLYSSRSARLFLAACPQDTVADLHPCLLSEAIRDGLPPDLAARAVVAARPEGAAMLSALGRVILSLLP